MPPTPAPDAAEPPMMSAVLAMERRGWSSRRSGRPPARFERRDRRSAAAPRPCRRTIGAADGALAGVVRSCRAARLAPHCPSTVCTSLDCRPAGPARARRLRTSPRRKSGLRSVLLPSVSRRTLLSNLLRPVQTSAKGECHCATTCHIGRAYAFIDRGHSHGDDVLRGDSRRNAVLRVLRLPAYLRCDDRFSV